MELADHWIDMQEEKARQAREWLILTMEAPAIHFVRGDQRLKLRVRNPSGEPARSIRIALEPATGIAWVHPQVYLDLLEGGKEAELGLDFHAKQDGSVRIAGQMAEVGDIHHAPQDMTVRA